MDPGSHHAPITSPPSTKTLTKTIFFYNLFILLVFTYIQNRIQTLTKAIKKNMHNSKS